MNLTITSDTDLAPLVGHRVRIVRAEPDGGRSVRYGVFESLRHSRMVPDSAGGMLLEEPHPGCRGGMTGFSVPYGSRVTTPPTSVPPVLGTAFDYGFDGRYRLWTVANGIDFDDMPPYGEGGPATVAVDGWHMSTSSLSALLSTPSVVAADDGKVTLHLWRGDPHDAGHHPLHGTKYDTHRDANRAAYEVGGLAFMVYEKHTHRYDALHV
jgi:hypothetical protein